MKYTIITPKQTLMNYNEENQVANYCMEVENAYLDEYATQEELQFESMTPVEIGFAYNTVGTEKQGCMVYETRDIMAAMKEEGADESTIEEARAIFNVTTEKPIIYPTYLDDVITTVTPVPISSLSGNVYTMENISSY